MAAEAVLATLPQLLLSRRLWKTAEQLVAQAALSAVKGFHEVVRGSLSVSVEDAHVAGLQTAYMLRLCSVLAVTQASLAFGADARLQRLDAAYSRNMKRVPSVEDDSELAKTRCKQQRQFHSIHSSLTLVFKGRQLAPPLRRRQQEVHGIVFRPNASHGLGLGVTTPTLVLGALVASRDVIPSAQQGPLPAYLLSSLLFGLHLLFRLSYYSSRDPFSSWRLVCAVSTAAGAVMYALAPSSNRLELVWLVMVSLLLSWVFLRLALKATERCFTLGEAAIVAQAAAFLITDAALLGWCVVSGGGETEGGGVGGSGGSEVGGGVCIGCVVNIGGDESGGGDGVGGVCACVCVGRGPALSAAEAVLSAAFCLSLLLPSLHRRTHGASLRIRAVFFWCCTLCSVHLLLAWLGLLTGARHALVWIIEFMTTPGHLLMIGYWLCVLCLGVRAALVRAPKQEDSQTSTSARVKGLAARCAARSRARLLLTRKLYHLLIVLIVVPAALCTPRLLQLSLALAAALFAALEAVRVAHVPPFGHLLSKFILRFTDDRDSGTIVLTHQYLLAGCALPVLLASASTSFERDAARPVDACRAAAPWAGVLVLGIGDAMASLVGLRFGRHKWRGTDKTVEGSAAAALSMLIAATPLLLPPMLPPMLPLLPYPLSHSLSHPLSHTLSNAQCAAAEEGIRAATAHAPDWLRLAGCTVWVCALEAKITQIDNLVLPLVYFGLLLIAAPFPDAEMNGVRFASTP